MTSEQHVMDSFYDKRQTDAEWGKSGETLRVFAGPCALLMFVGLELVWGNRCGAITSIERDTGYVTVKWHEEFWHVEGHDEGRDRRYLCRDSMEGIVSRELVSDEPLIAPPVPSKETN